MLVNGQSVDSISIRDRGLLYGDGVFRTLRISNGQALHWSLHFHKLFNDCARLGITCPDEKTLRAELDTVLAQHPHGVAKLMVTRGVGGRGYAPGVSVPPTRIWDFFPAPDYSTDCATRGVKVLICKLRLSEQMELAGVKHLNRIENVLAAAELSATRFEDGIAAEGLMMDAAGHLIEGTRSNLFMVVEGRLITPDLSRCGVAGIQRERVMAWSHQHGMALQVRNIRLEEALLADELFIVNSVFGLWPIRQFGTANELGLCHWNHFPLATKIRLDLF